jgi:hypothetical protein
VQNMRTHQARPAVSGPVRRCLDSVVRTAADNRESHRTARADMKDRDQEAQGKPHLHTALMRTLCGVLNLT